MCSHNDVKYDNQLNIEYDDSVIRRSPDLEEEFVPPIM
jgi:hypothetical protein